MGASVDKVEPKKFVLPAQGKMTLFVMMGIGALCFAAGMFVDKERVWHSYLVSYFYFVSLALGGLFFTAIHYASGAGWNVTVRRFFEAFSSFVPAALIGGLVLVLAGSHSLYSWLDTELVNGDPILKGKQSYLNMTFFVIRLLVFCGLWLVFAKKIVGLSVRQDESGDESLTHAQTPWAVGFIAVFALSYSLYSVDLMMSLEPHWFSTIFGVYCFAGLFQSCMAFAILLILYVMKKGLVDGLITMDHVHDLAKYLKGFTVFWAYIAFSQFMLIWYANLPEETIFFIHRSHGGWMVVSIALLIFKFIVPFIALLPRWAKRTPKHLVAVCLLVLVMQFVDLFWLVLPQSR